MFWKRRHTSFATFTSVCLLLMGTVSAADNPIERISVSSAGGQGNNFSWEPTLSQDGRFVAFQSAATNLVAGDTNGKIDCFERDRLTGQTIRISVSSAGVQGNGDCVKYISPKISWDGRYVVFASDATNLIAGMTIPNRQVYVHDRITGTTSLVSADSSGVPAGGAVTDNFGPAISGDGRYIVFMSAATNLVLNDTNGAYDVFRHDMQTGTTERASVGILGFQADGGSYIRGPNSISSDGRYIVFESDATNLVFGSDANGMQDVFIRDMQLGINELVSVDSGGSQGNQPGGGPAMSADGRYVAFISSATNLDVDAVNGLTQAFLRDRTAGTTILLSMSNDGSTANDNVLTYPVISGDGRFVMFESPATNLVSGDTNGKTDIFLRDWMNGQTIRVSLSAAGVQGNDESSWGEAVSADGRYIAFSSQAGNLVPGDTNGYADAFVALNRLNDAPNRNALTALPLTLKWGAVSWAAQYEVQVSRSATFSGTPDYAVTTLGNTPETTIAFLPVGVYYWRVRAKKADGTTGGWSVAETFTIAAP